MRLGWDSSLIRTDEARSPGASHLVSEMWEFAFPSPKSLSPGFSPVNPFQLAFPPNPLIPNTQKLRRLCMLFPPFRYTCLKAAKRAFSSTRVGGRLGVPNHVGAPGRLLFRGKTGRCSNSARSANAANRLFSETLDSKPFAFSGLGEMIKDTSGSKQTT